LAEYGVALEELHHARGDGAAEERSTVEAANDARGEFEFRGEGGFDARGIFFGAAFGEGLAKEFARAHGVEKAFAGEGSTQAAASPMSAQFLPMTRRSEKVRTRGEGRTWL